MANLKDLSTILGEGHRLPILGKEYLVPHVRASTGLQFAAFTSAAIAAVQAEETGKEVQISAADQEILSDEQEADLYRDALTPAVYDEMEQDGVPFEHLRIAAMYVLIHAVMGEAQAAEYWATGGKGRPQNRATRRTGTPTRTAAARTTRKRG